MNAFEFREVSFAYDRDPVLRDVSLVAPHGGITVVIGPSGSGKTTLLRLLAGFERPKVGSVLVQGTVVAGPDLFVPPHRRAVGIVPQEGALFPHLRVAENIAFGLDRRAASTPGRVEELLDLTGLGDLSRRFPRELSGGQQQRVALARALAPRPQLVLLDEPFASLDPQTRHSVREGVSQALRRESASALVVTHDREEALSLGDMLVVMAAGQVLQTGTADEVYLRPASRQCASILGEANYFDVRANGPACVTTVLGSHRLLDPSTTAEPGRAEALVRPEQVELCEEGVAGTVLSSDYVGSESLVRVALEDGSPVLARLRNAHPVPGDRLRLGVRGPVHLVGKASSGTD